MKNYQVENLIFYRIFVNIILFNLCFLGSWEIVLNWKNLESIFQIFPQRWEFLIFTNLILIFGYWFFNPYSFDKQFFFWKIFKASLKVWMFLFFSMLFLILMLRINYSRSQFLLFITSYLFLLCLENILFIQWIKRKKQKHKFKINLIIIGKNQVSTKIIKLLKNNQHHYQFVKLFDEKAITSKKLINTLEEESIDEIFISLMNLEKKTIDYLINLANSRFIKLKLIDQYNFSFDENPFLNQIIDIPVINLNSFPLEKTSNRFLKRCFDLSLATMVILLLLSWLTPLLAILIKLDSRGSIFHLQKRTGRGGKIFYCLKFRSMIEVESSTQKNTLVTDDEDVRITKLGRWIRKRHIDELPQFINVFLGSMSLVGPRPHMLDVDLFYQKKVDSFQFRYFVKPGITGLAQVVYEREKGINNENLKVLEKKIKLDIFYINHWSFFLDMKIVFLTTKIILLGDPKSI